MAVCSNTPRYDILGVGCAAVDDLLYVDNFPTADQKSRIKCRARQCGGLTATALVSAARLGARCAYSSVLGNSESSRYVLDTLAAEKIDVSHVVRSPVGGPIHSVIIVDTTHHTRNIFFYPPGICGEVQAPAEEVILASTVLFVDHVDMRSSLRAAQIASGAGIPVVADLECRSSQGFDALLELVDHLILSAQFAKELIGCGNPAENIGELWSRSRAAVVITDGANGCWYKDSATTGHCPAFPVNVVDTTGCGDVFHGSYAFALARGMPIAERLRFASAVAALKATKPGGQDGIPDLPSVISFLETR